jgi:hypothetical protein
MPLYKRAEAPPHSRQVKAESLEINSVWATPYVANTRKKKRPERASSIKYCISPFQGLGGEFVPNNRALPYPDDNKAFSLNLTAMPYILSGASIPGKSVVHSAIYLFPEGYRFVVS